LWATAKIIEATVHWRRFSFLGLIRAEFHLENGISSLEFSAALGFSEVFHSRGFGRLSGLYRETVTFISFE
jgi:hypothetical protein